MFLDKVLLRWKLYRDAVTCQLCCSECLNVYNARSVQLLTTARRTTFCRAVGISLLFWIALNCQVWGNAQLMVPVYVVRTSLMNANCESELC
jgi:hypothetical protein